jgi:hypothetical protein
MGSELAKLRPVQESDLRELVRLLWDPDAPGEFQWFGFRMATAREIERRWHDDGLIGETSFLTVESDDGCAGWVTWRVLPTGNVEIGIALSLSTAAAGSEPRLNANSCSTYSTRRLCTGSKQAPRSTTWPSRVR